MDEGKFDEKTRELALAELDSLLRGVNEEIRVKEKLLSSLRMPKTRNAQVRAKMKVRRDEIKKYIAHRKTYREELTKNHRMISTLVVEE